MQDHPNTPHKLLPTLGYWAVVSIFVGTVIGSGIFRKPALMAAQLHSPEWLLAVWMGAGLVTLFGALANAEVAAMMPRTGGQYLFFREMYGDFFAFLFGWATFGVIQTAGIASITYVFAEYAEFFVPLPRLAASTEQAFEIYVPFIGTFYPLENLGVKALTIVGIMVLTLVNMRSLHLGQGVQNVFTILKIALIAGLVGAAFAYTQGTITHFTQDDPAGTLLGWPLVSALVAACSGAFWAYDGWNTVPYVAGEVRDPQRNIPRALLVGSLVVLAVFAIINLAYLYVLPIHGMAASKLVAADVAAVAMGSIGAGFVAGAVMVSAFGASNSQILTGARLYYAMAMEQRFFRSMGRVHPRYHTPHIALLVQGLWSSMLVLSGGFDRLTDMLILVSWVFYGMGGLGIFVLRRKWPQVHRPYRCWGYPYTPIIFVLFSAVFVVVTVVNDITAYVDGTSPIINSVWGLALLAPALPLYFYFKRSQAASAPPAV